MTASLERAFAAAERLPPGEQDWLASLWLAELAELDAEDAFDQRIAETAHLLDDLARRAIAEDEAGLTRELDPEAL
jgi:hypothetical protein